MAAAPTQVLLSRELLPLVAAYQEGITYDLVPLMAWNATHQFPEMDVVCTELLEQLTEFDQLMTQWYSLHDLDRLDSHVFPTLPHWKPLWIAHHAAWRGHFHVLKFLGNQLPQTVLDIAAANNQLGVLQSFSHLRASRRAMDWASKFGHLEVVQFLRKTRYEGCTARAFSWACAGGYLKVAQFLVESDMALRIGSEQMDWAAIYGHLDVVKFLHDKGYTCTTTAMDMAAHNGHLNVVEFLHEHRSEGCTTNAMDYAAKNGHLHVVEFLHTKRTEGCSTLAKFWAQQNGHHHVVRYLEANCSEIATTKSLTLSQQCMQWLLYAQ